MKLAAAVTGLRTGVPIWGTTAALLLCPLALATPRSAPAPDRGRIEGVVRLVAPAPAQIQGAVYPSRRVSRPAPKASEIKHVVVFLKDAPAEKTLPQMAATIVQTNETFVPRVVAVTRGSTVSFPNSDPYFHNVFSLSPGATFDLGRYRQGETRARRFAAAGLVKVYCHIHSHMTASIMIFDHPYFRVPDADGAFVLEDVPAGVHRVSAWHERIGESIASIRVEPGRTARVEFALPVDTP